MPNDPVRFEIPGLPSVADVAIEFPDMAELLMMPIFRRAEVEAFRRHAAEYQKGLLDACPARGGFKHTYVDCSVQLLHPGVTSLGSRGGDDIMDWHLDGIRWPGDKPSVFHAVCTPCTATTEFNARPTSLELPAGADINHINRQVHAQASALGLEGQRMLPGRVLTWSNHVHRATPPQRPEFRFFFRLTESDLMGPLPDDQALVSISVVHGRGAGWPAKISVENRPEGILLHKTW